MVINSRVVSIKTLGGVITKISDTNFKTLLTNSNACPTLAGLNFWKICQQKSSQL